MDGEQRTAAAGALATVCLTVGLIALAIREGGWWHALFLVAVPLALAAMVCWQVVLPRGDGRRW